MKTLVHRTSDFGFHFYDPVHPANSDYEPQWEDVQTLADLRRIASGRKLVITFDPESSLPDGLTADLLVEIYDTYRE